MAKTERDIRRFLASGDPDGDPKTESEIRLFLARGRLVRDAPSPDLATDVTAVALPPPPPTIDFSASQRLGLMRPAPPDLPSLAERLPVVRPLAASSTAVGRETPRRRDTPALTAPTDRLGEAMARALGARDIEATREFRAKTPIGQDVARVLAGVARAPFVGSVPRALGVDPEEQARIDPSATGAILRGAGTLGGVAGEILLTKGVAGQLARGAKAGTVRDVLRLTAETRGGTVGRRAARGALEGIPTDVGFAVRDPDLSLAESVALGSGVGAVGEVILPGLFRALRSGDATTSVTPERIDAPAIRTSDGRVFQGRIHAIAVDEATKAGALPEGALSSDFTSGFLTDTGRFVERNEARRIAEIGDQLDDVELPPAGEVFGGLDADDLSAVLRADVRAEEVVDQIAARRVGIQGAIAEPDMVERIAAARERRVQMPVPPPERIRSAGFTITRTSADARLNAASPAGEFKVTDDSGEAIGEVFASMNRSDEGFLDISMPTDANLQNKIGARGVLDLARPVIEAFEAAGHRVTTVGGMRFGSGRAVRIPRERFAAPTIGPEVPRVSPEGVPVPPPRIVSLKKAEGAAIRDRLGLDALDAPQRQSFADAWDTASEQRLSENAIETAEVAAAERRPLRPEEHAAAVQRQLILEDQLVDSRNTLETAARAGNDEVVQRESLRTDGILGQIDALTRAIDRVGTEAGRALSARRISANADTHTLAANLQQARAVKGMALTHAEVGKIEVLNTRAKKIDADVEIELRKVEETETSQKRVLADAVVVAEARQAVRSGGGSAKRLVVERNDLLEQLAKMGHRLNDVSGVSGEGLYLIGRLAVNTIRTSVLQTGERVALSGIVDSVLRDLNNPSLTARDIHEALNARNPKAVARARSEVQAQVTELRSQARILTKIEDAESGIFAPAARRPPRSREISALQRNLTELRQAAYRTGQDSRRIERAVKRINDLQDQLTTFKRTVRRPHTEAGPELSSLREKIRGLRQEMGVEDRLLILEDQLRTGEFRVPEPRRRPPSSLALEAKQIALKRARGQVRSAIQAMRPRTTRGVIRAGTELARTIKATADISATMRQGFLLSARRPLLAARTFDKTVRAFFSTNTADQIDNAIRQHPNQLTRDRAGLDLSDIGSGVTGEREEFFASNLASRIPVFGAVVRASERSMTTTLNLLRTAAFDGFLDSNPNATIDELRAWADYVNVASGRGNLGRLGAIGTELSVVIFAPRFAVSRFQAPTRLFKFWQMPRVRKEIAKDYAAVAGVGLMTLALADLAGLEVGLDPRNPDFGKIRFGDTRIDIWGGIQQPMRLVARVLLGATDKAGLTGRTLTDPEKDVDPLELLGRFAAFKLSPFVTIPLELYRGQSAVGESRTPSQTAVRSLLPLVLEDVLEAHRAAGPGTAAITGGLALIGVGVSTFQDSEGRVRREVRKLLEEGRGEEASRLVIRWNDLNPDNRILSVRPRRPTPPTP